MARVNDRTTVVGAATAFAEKHVEVDGYRIRYLEGGQGEPLVCLHGASGLQVSGAYEQLGAACRVLLFEVPGFGQSPANQQSASMKDLAATMNRAVAALGLERYSLLGHSFGGRLALWMAVQAPERLHALVLAAPAVLGSGQSWRVDALLDQQGRGMHAHPERQPASPAPDAAVLAKQETLVRRLYEQGRDAELESQLTELNVPVLVLFGTDDGVIPPETGALYRESLPNCHYILVYDAGHAMDADRPEAFATIVSDFLERREAFVVNRTNALIDP